MKAGSLESFPVQEVSGTPSMLLRKAAVMKRKLSFVLLSSVFISIGCASGETVGSAGAGGKGGSVSTTGSGGRAGSTGSGSGGSIGSGSGGSVSVSGTGGSVSVTGTGGSTTG